MRWFVREGIKEQIMGDTKNLISDEAIEKIKHLAESANTCHFVTALTKLPLSTRPMATQKVDEDGSLWFMSDKNSSKNHEIQNDNRVQLFLFQSKQL